MTVLQKIIEKFKQGRFPANEKLIPGWLEDEFGKQEEQQIRDAWWDGRTSKTKDIETYLTHLKTKA